MDVKRFLNGEGLFYQTERPTEGHKLSAYSEDNTETGYEEQKELQRYPLRA